MNPWLVFFMGAIVGTIVMHKLSQLAHKVLLAEAEQDAKRRMAVAKSELYDDVIRYAEVRIREHYNEQQFVEGNTLREMVVHLMQLRRTQQFVEPVKNWRGGPPSAAS